MTTPPDDDVWTRPFADLLRDMGKGSTHEELGDSLRQLVQRVRDTGKKGSLTLTITVEPMAKGGDDALIVADEIKVKLPEFERPTSLFFADPNGNLMRNNPAQLAFESLREVPPVPAGVDPATGEIMEGTPRG